MTPTRPLTHDLFKSFAVSFGIKIKEVVIYNLNEGIFYAKLICEREGHISEIDARTSDAIALGIRFKCPIYTFENILASAGIIYDENQDMNTDLTEEKIDEDINPMGEMDINELERLLEEALSDEDYERASKIRDEINKRK